MRKLLMTATAVAGVMGLAVAAHAAPTGSGMQSGLGGDSVPFAATSSLPGPTGLPGQVQFYFRGRLHTDFMVGGDSLDNRGGTKSGNVYFGEYARLYSGFEGVAANGLKFGAMLEVRTNGGSAAPFGNANLYFRRELGYLQGNWGTFRFGQADQVLGLFQTGGFENFDDGGWNGDLPVLFSGNAQLNWPTPEDGGAYGTSSISYISPSFSGFDFGISYEPNDTGSGEAQCGPVSCNRNSTIATGGQARRNAVQVVGRYQGDMGPAKITAELGGWAAGHVHVTETPASNPSMVIGGLTVAVGGWAVGGTVITGNTALAYGSLVPLAKGSKHEMSFIAGTSYAFGPFIVGASYLDMTSDGAHTGFTRHEVGIAAGGTYAWAPGTAAFVSFLYGHRHQVGYDFASGKVGSLDSNNTSAMGMLIGNTFNW